jgi:DNA modification methylase
VNWPTWTSPDGRVRLINADCAEVLPTLTGIDAVVTDPPYGIGAANRADGGAVCSRASGSKDYGERSVWDSERPSKAIFDAILGRGVPTTIWGGNYFTDYLTPTGKWLIWDKGQEDFSLADVEMAWCSWQGAARRKLLPRSHALKDGKVHPTQKPVTIIEWNIRQLPKGWGECICDPFGGSATTAVACSRMDLRCVCIERDPAYFAIGKRRLKWEYQRTELFNAQEAIA